MHWRLSHRADPVAARIADRHYNRQSVGSNQFVPPGRCLVLLAKDALWVSSWPFKEYVKHAWGGAWICSCFRNESKVLSSELIREAVAITRWKWGRDGLPELGFITFVDTGKVRPKYDFGYCYKKAGWKECGKTKGGLLALQLLPEEIPEPVEPLGAQGEFISVLCTA